MTVLCYISLEILCLLFVTGEDQITQLIMAAQEQASTGSTEAGVIPMVLVDGEGCNLNLS